MHRSLRTWLEKSIPQPLRRDPDTLRRARLLVYTATTGSLWGPFFAPLYFWLFDAPQAATALLIAAAAISLVPLVLRATAHLRLAVYLLASVLFAIVLVVTLARGGYPVSGLMWSMAIPLLVQTLLGSRDALVWCGLVCTKYVGLAILYKRGALPFLMDADSALLLDTLGLLGFTILLMSIIWIYERERRRTLMEKDEAVRVKAEFLSRISHEIRTPLNGVLGVSRLVLETPLDPQQLDYLRTIRRSSKIVLELIEQLLDFTQTDPSTTPPPPDLDTRPPNPAVLASGPLSLLTTESSAHILVVEDNAVNRLVTEQTLIRLGYKVDLAINGLQALATLEQGTFDLVLMDCGMPVMDGYEATLQIRQNPSWESLPIVAMTAHAQPSDREKCLEVGMNDYLPKPVSAEVLAATLERWLEGR
jgi:CheY-like chemotaxis protein